MRIMIDSITRDMTAKEEEDFRAFHESLPPLEDEATTANYEEALTRFANELTGANDHDLISATETLIEQRIKN